MENQLNGKFNPDRISHSKSWICFFRSTQTIVRNNVGDTIIISQGRIDQTAIIEAF